jgi:hypothetical protein
MLLKIVQRTTEPLDIGKSMELVIDKAERVVDLRKQYVRQRDDRNKKAKRKKKEALGVTQEIAKEDASTQA